MKFINKPLYYYRQHGSGISQRKRKNYAIREGYLSKLKAYSRRLNTDIPNIKQKDLRIEYYRVVFSKPIILLKDIICIFKIDKFLKEFAPNSIKNILNKITYFSTAINFRRR